jgi:hypothetical protein
VGIPVRAAPLARREAQRTTFPERRLMQPRP